VADSGGGVVSGLAAAPFVVWAVALPLGGAVLTFLLRSRAAAVGWSFALATTAVGLALAWQVAAFGVQRHAVGGWGAPLGIDLQADGLSALMIAVTAVVGLGVSGYATGYFKGADDHAEHERTHFWPLWLMLWTALNGLFLAADVFNAYVTLELLGLSAVALVALAATPAALTGAMRYLLVGLLGSLLYLLGVGLLYGATATLDFAQLAGVDLPVPAGAVALGLITAGLMLKTAIFPFHFWLPPAHASAPAPVSALLSALVVKASFYLLARYWLQVAPELVTPVLVALPGVLGAAAVIWGGLRALTADRLKLVVAYSTVAQIGYLFLLFPLVHDNPAAFTAWGGVALLVAAHATAKAAMFLSAGAFLKASAQDRVAGLDGTAQALPVTTFAFALAGVSLIGLPPSGGFAAKWMLLNAALTSGQWWWVIVLVVGSLLAAAYTFRVLTHAFTRLPEDPPHCAVPARLEWSALGLALVAILLGFVAGDVLDLVRVGAPFAGPALGAGTP
jgi:formate hydrogenlyase subunit 3/multisubunit Na+/H+ antiporter MnhD subunit